MRIVGLNKMNLIPWILRASQGSRLKRSLLFENLIKQKMISQPGLSLSLLDVGGTEEYWHQVGSVSEEVLKITLLNLEPSPTRTSSRKWLACDARRLCFNDCEFDVVFSNSVIEHIDDHKRVADEIRRVGKAYWVQTPNYYFPIEPHTFIPFLQFFPPKARPYLVQYFAPKERRGLKREILDIQMLKRRELEALFPEAQIWEEKMFGLTKSFVALAGWNDIHLQCEECEP